MLCYDGPRYILLVDIRLDKVDFHFIVNAFSKTYAGGRSLFFFIINYLWPCSCSN